MDENQKKMHSFSFVPVKGYRIVRDRSNYTFKCTPVLNMHETSDVTSVDEPCFTLCKLC